MNSTLSVVIPVYNVEKYLDRCIRSVVNQTFDDMEIILVDDGSSNLSGQICDIWKEKDQLSLHACISIVITKTVCQPAIAMTDSMQRAKYIIN